MAYSKKQFFPRDRTKREHTAFIDRVIWAAEDDSRIILACTDGSSHVGPGGREQFTQGQRFRFLGRWVDSKFGPQFQFDTFIPDTPGTRDGIVKYLGEVCRNIGKVTAVKLWDAYGPDAVRMLREQPNEVAAARILSANAAQEANEDLAANAHLEKTRIDLFGIFSGRGFPGKLIERAIAKWGVRAPSIIAKNPFAMLVSKLPGCSFSRCDKLYLDGGKSPLALKRQALAGWNAFRTDRTGSTWLTAEVCRELIEDRIPRGEPIQALQLLIRAAWVRIVREYEGGPYLALRANADAERAIATHVRRLRKSPSLWPKELATSKAEGDGRCSDHQAAEFLKATAESIGAFVGGPGTGKTFTLADALREVVAVYGVKSVAVCAPTGKASVRAGESLRASGLSIHATTIHQLLEIGRSGHDGDGWGFQRNANNPLDCRFLIIDESSMIDTNLMSELLAACADGTQVLLVGDPYQLPPVGHGAPLRDLLAGGIASGELSEVRRNSGTIVRACAAIKNGEAVPLDSSLNLEAESPANLKIIDCYEQQVPEAVQDVLQAITKFDRVWDTQIITGLNDKSPSSRTKLNEQLGKFLNPDGQGARGNPFRVGDKIICRRNTRLKTFAPIVRKLSANMAGDAGNYTPRAFVFHGLPVEEWYVANGEIGRVIAVGEKGSIVRFGVTGGSASEAAIASVPLVFVPVGKRDTSPGDEGEDGGEGKQSFEPAWAITVHGSQGSEWPCVICVIDDAANQIADRNYWYTAISRAKTACLLIGPKGVFDKQVKRQRIDKRKTFLAEILNEATT
jgi:exodeoxyribonuclease V alpha subunit